MTEKQKKVQGYSPKKESTMNTNRQIAQHLKLKMALHKEHN